ncbi:hypothetical protein [Antrihabitans sp. YC2-6]|uniref:hypothetical protein n=1 Tax=Antrihabitans sp. YC2-6 TaxID=2799498 RepID=UPI0018F46825|nr:hypothetical protein [Antrihabitans sp. YC2-6]MBJ8345638.1 hypothetical protein [Antrihabitans sp. YC2-6]
MTDEGTLEYWRRLSREAASGELNLDPAIAAEIQDACESFVSELQIAREKAAFLGNIVGIGGLDSANELAAKFVDKAVGPGGLIERLEQNIDIVRLISETVSHSVKTTIEVDEAIGDALSSVTGVFDR